MKLYQNYQIHLILTTIITYEIPTRGLVTIIIYDVLGKKITTLVNEEKTPGEYKVLFDGSYFPVEYISASLSQIPSEKPAVLS